MIEATGLIKSYRSKPVLRGLSFTAKAGEITLMIGPNGAGKSTTMRILSGLARADQGDAVIAGVSVRRDRMGAQRQLSFLPQTPNFHPRFTCAQLVSFYARLRGLDSAPRREQVLETAGLRDVQHDQVRTLSGGMRQRLGLALLILPDAPVLLLDEPGISLDPDWRLRMQSLLRDEASAGKAVLVATHLIGEWNNVAHRCLVCREGVIHGEVDPGHLTDALPPSTTDQPRSGKISSSTVSGAVVGATEATP